MIRQTTFNLSAKRRDCHLVAQEVLDHLLVGLLGMTRKIVNFAEI